MLQQTTVGVVIPYFTLFLERFPTVFSLAQAPEDEVLGAWSGLGYYHRARNLLRGARHVVQTHGGEFPKTLEGALRVPGVGLYTASAILSIAHGLPLPVVDGNVRRVLARLYALSGKEARKEGPYYNRAGELLAREDAGEWNQAVMELGALVCRPAKPACPACPLRSHCRAFALGTPEAFPPAARRRAAVKVTIAAALVLRSGELLLVKRKEGRLMGRMWEVPQTSLESRGLPDLVREMKEAHGLEIVPGALVVRARHAITHRRISLEGYRASLKGRAPKDEDRFLWVAPSALGGLPVGSITRKLVKGLYTPQMPLDLS